MDKAKKQPHSPGRMQHFATLSPSQAAEDEVNGAETSVFFSTPRLGRSLMAGGVFGAALWLYLTTLAPSVVTLFDDSLEFQLVTYQLGIAHPTGYPLYTLLGKLFTFLPMGNVAYRVNLMSAVFGALTVALVYLLILQVAGQGRAGSEERGAESER